MSKGYQAAAECNTAGYASRDEAAAAGMREYQPRVAAMDAKFDPHEIGFLIYELENRYYYSDPVVGEARFELSLNDFKSIRLPEGSQVTDAGHIHPILGRNVEGEPYPYPLTDNSTVVSPMSIDDERVQSSKVWRSTFGFNDDSRCYVGTPDGRMGVYSVSGRGIPSSLPRLTMPGMDLPAQRTAIKAGEQSMKARYTRFR